MASNKITYNIPGCGNLTANIFEYTQAIIDHLDYYGHIDRLRRINQLGRLREVFQGAHHNRYEYVFLQWSLISELCTHKKSDLGLSANRDFCGTISELKKEPSLGELLQCLVLLNNMGHLEGTFASARAWMSFMKQNRAARIAFSKGLEQQDRKSFDRLLENYNYYRFNQILALFQLQRYKRTGDDTVDFCSNILRTYRDGDPSNVQILQFQKLFDSIRQLAFITLDSFYSAVPFRLDLSSIILNFDSLQDSLFIKNTTYKIALSNLEQVLQDAVYLSSDACLNTARASEEELASLHENASGITGITGVYNLVCPRCVPNFSESKIKKLDWIKEKKLIQQYDIKASDTDLKGMPFDDEVKWETQIRKKIGKSFIRVALLKSPNCHVVKLAIGLMTPDNADSLRVVLKSISEIRRFHSIMEGKYFNPVDANNDALFTFILKSLFGWNKRFILTNKVREKSAVIISNGRIAAQTSIGDFIAHAATRLNADELFEIEKTRDLISKLAFSGLTICYVGNIRIFKEGSSQESAEVDGIVVFPTIAPSDEFAFILEAKNYANGITDARKQLRDKPGKELIDELQMTVNDLDNRAAYGAVQLRATLPHKLQVVGPVTV